MAKSKVCVVMGAGPGTGASLCRRFAAGGYRVAAVARNRERLDEAVGGLAGVEAFPGDVTDAAQVRTVFDRVRDELGVPDVVLYNAGWGSWGALDETSADDLRRAWEVNALGLFHVAKAALPVMRERGSGALGITGATATRRGKPATTAFAQAKAAQHHLAESFARELGPAGVHVFYLVVDGVISTPRTRERMPDKLDDFFVDPDDIAGTMWEIAHQSRSAWTFELEVRPYCESW